MPNNIIFASSFHESAKMRRWLNASIRTYAMEKAHGKNLGWRKSVQHQHLG